MRQKLKNSDLFWVNDCCWAARRGDRSQYKSGCGKMQMELLAADHGEVDIIESKFSFAKRVARNLDNHKGQTVRRRNRAVYRGRDPTGQSTWRLDAGDPEKSIVIAPVRQEDGTIHVVEEWMVEDLLGLDQETTMPEEGTWDQWVARSPSPPVRDDEARASRIEYVIQ